MFPFPYRRVALQRPREDDSKLPSFLPPLLLGLNVLGAIAHGVGILLVQTQARKEITLDVWNHVLKNTGTRDDPIWTQMRASSPINPCFIITWFFALSFSFHSFIVLILLARYWVGSAWWNEWYFDGIYANVALWRWLEYFFSAPLMMLIAAPMIGVRELHSIWAVVGSMGVTILFGWITELHSSALIKTAPVARTCPCRRSWMLTRRWTPGSWRTRLQIHLLGYFPYALSWGIIFDRFRINMKEIGDLIPEFVNWTVFASFALFTLFGITQLILQVYTYGPSLYWVGEVSYVTLSFAAKAQLGIVVLYQALVDGALFDRQLSFTTSGNIN